MMEEDTGQKATTTKDDSEPISDDAKSSAAAAAAQVRRMRVRHPKHVPVVVQVRESRHDGIRSSAPFILKKSKFMVAGDHDVASFCMLIRKYMDNLHPSTGLYFFCASPVSGSLSLVQMTLTMGALESRFVVQPPGKDKDANDRPALVIHLAGEDTFGSMN